MNLLAFLIGNDVVVGGPRVSRKDDGIITAQPDDCCPGLLERHFFSFHKRRIAMYKIKVKPATCVKECCHGDARQRSKRNVVFVKKICFGILFVFCRYSTNFAKTK
jgi:hypothetical protein